MSVPLECKVENFPVNIRLFGFEKFTPRVMQELADNWFFLLMFCFFFLLCPFEKLSSAQETRMKFQKESSRSECHILDPGISVLCRIHSSNQEC